MSFVETIKSEARALGFDAVGIASVEAIGPASDPDQPANHQLSHEQTPTEAGPLVQRLHRRLHAWLEAGYQATMAWIARDPARRSDPRRVLEGCRSLIMVGMNYDSGHRPDEGPGMGRIARYAWGRDYHEILGAKLATLTERLSTLAPNHRFRWYVDTGPVMEKAWAEQAGLGWIGKHSNLVSPEHGSWLLLGSLLTTLELTPDPPGTDLCGTCSLCIQACPTGAIVEPYVVDARRCISYLTIEHRGDDLPAELTARMGNHIFGCDDCLDVCPFNGPAPDRPASPFSPFGWTVRPALESLLSWSETEFASRTHGSPIRRAKHAGFHRNLKLAQHNSRRRSTGNTEPGADSASLR